VRPIAGSAQERRDRLGWSIGDDHDLGPVRRVVSERAEQSLEGDGVVGRPDDHGGKR